MDAFADALDAESDRPSELSALEALLRADNVPAPVTLAVRPGRAQVDELMALGAEPGRWSPFAAVLPKGDPAGLELVRTGAVGVQDEGSQLVALAFAATPLVGVQGPERWLDLCAGPGGKAALLDGLSAQRDATLVANEPHSHRADLVRRAVSADVDIVVGDGRRGPWEVGSFDRVLVDAPCSGLGALRRRPEARWRRQRADIDQLVELQRSLLLAALEAVRPGGVVAYVTCSPMLEESRQVVDGVLAERPGLERLDAREQVRAVATAAHEDLPLGQGPDVQLWPHLHGTDAMYLALLRRR